jgi:YjjG family noncanonical pyrimidine nucleotidase
MIKTVFIDIDNTVLCFYKCADKALRNAFKRNCIEFKDEYLPKFFKINDKLWRMVEEGALTREEVHEIRLRLVFKELGIDGDARKTEGYFLEEIERTAEPVDGAKDLLIYLSSKYKVYAASNSIYTRQVARLKIADFYKYLSGVIVSDLVGANKPSKEFFEYCLKTAQTSAENCVMIGDSLHADMFGAKNVGMTTIWYNHLKIDKPNSNDYDYYIESLSEIKKIL